MAISLAEVSQALLAAFAVSVAALGFYLFCETFFHKHDPHRTGRRIYAVYGKANLPAGEKAVQSIGAEALCMGCRAHLIIHDESMNFPQPVSEIEEFG